MKKYTFILLCMIVGLCFFFVYKLSNNNKKQLQAKTIVVTQTISSKRFTKTYDTIKIEEGKTALSLLEQTTNVQTQGSGTNAFVVSINGAAADNKASEYWSFEVNGKPSSVGAGSYVLKQKDTILWSIKKF